MTGLTRTKRINRMSPRKRREIDESRPVVAAMYKRDEYTCVLASRDDVAGRCFGWLTPHHIIKQSRRRGLWVPENLVTLCSHHNDWVELNRPVAKRLGLVAREYHELRQAWRDMRIHGLTVGQLTTWCTGPERQLSFTSREIRAGEAACERCGHPFALLIPDDGGPGVVLARHEAVW